MQLDNGVYPWQLLFMKLCPETIEIYIHVLGYNLREKLADLSPRQTRVGLVEPVADRHRSFWSPPRAQQKYFWQVQLDPPRSPPWSKSRPRVRRGPK